MGRRVIDGPDRSRLLIDVPTGILIDIRSTDITSAIGSVSFPTFTGTSPIHNLSTPCLVILLISLVAMLPVWGHGPLTRPLVGLLNVGGKPLWTSTWRDIGYVDSVCPVCED